LIFSDLDPFELSGLLAKNKINSKAKPGQVLEKDLTIEAGPTDMMAGPALTDFSNAKIKVGIEQGKIAIKEPVIIKKGVPISPEMANILDKLEIKPIMISIKPAIAYDSAEIKIYKDIKIDAEEALSRLAQALSEATNLAFKIDYPCKETIAILLAKANSHALAINSLLPKTQ
jgi:large subunit ribosomal protein L10